MSVLSHGIKNRHEWNRISQFAEQRRRAASPDWFFYLALVLLMFFYRTELIGVLEKYFNGVLW